MRLVDLLYDGHYAGLSQLNGCETAAGSPNGCALAICKCHSARYLAVIAAVRFSPSELASATVHRDTR